MTDSEKLTYYEYWLTKKYWNAEFAIYMLFDYMKIKKGWEDTDDYMQIMRSFHDKLKAQMANEDAKHIFGMLVTDVERWDEVTDIWIETGVDTEESQVKPMEFLEWVYKKGYQLPYEFKQFIGVADVEEKRLTQREAERIDKAVCQGIGQTLWDEYPNLNNEDMQYHHAIQHYGGGKGYPADTTLRRWLSEVDPRSVKTGRKRKL
ncbi:hypothetical protein [Geomonas ferrireducens]|uniref:hypothetical protein n=1 Tax=Geomonas ferrireducens TaxID=2570227 RepID=UPI0010A7EF79|nr:hypothetical protein [Geomonas ferrireducens]